MEKMLWWRTPAWLIFLAGVTFALCPTDAPGQQSGAPLSLEQIIELHKNEVPCRPLALRITERSVSFAVTADIMGRLKREQICDQAIREIERKGAELVQRKKIEEERAKLDREKKQLEEERERETTLARVREFIRAGKSYLDQGAYPQALNEFEKASGLTPASAEVAELLDDARRAERTEAAIEAGPLGMAVLERLLAGRVAPKRVAILVAQRNVNFFALSDEKKLRDMGANDEVIVVIKEKVLANKPPDGTRPQSLANRAPDKPRPQAPVGAEEARLVSVGIGMMQQQKYHAALEQSERALRLNGAYDKAWELKGDSLHGLKRSLDAVSSYDKVLDLNPVNALIWSKKGLVLHELSLHREAVQSFERSLEIDPTNHSIWVSMGDSLLAMKRCDDARGSYERGLQANPNLQRTLEPRYERLKSCGS